MLLTDKDLGVSVRLGLLTTAATVFVSQWYAVPASVPAAAPFVVLAAILAVRGYIKVKGAANTTADEKLDAAEDIVVEMADKLTPEQLAIAGKAAAAVRNAIKESK